MRRWKVVPPVLCLAIAAVFVGWGSTPAVAAVQSTVGLSSSTIAPGASVTITADFSDDATGELPGSVGIDVRRLGTGTGSVDYYQSTIGPELFGCTIGRAVDGVQFICGWNNPSPGQSASITLTLAASTDAIGQWAVETIQAPRSGGVPPSSAGASVSFVVAASPTGSMPPRGVNSTVSLGASTIEAGDTVTIAADFTLDPVGLRPFVVGIEVRRRTAGTGSVDYVQSVITPELFGCTIGRADGGVQYICLWNNSPGQRASITLVLAASADAHGQWDVSTVQSSSTSGGAVSPAGAAVFFVVGAGVPTTPPSSDSSSTSPALSVAPPTDELPNTGVGDASTVVSLGIGLMGAGGLLIVLTRRGSRHA